MNLGAERRQAAEREAVLKERLATVREALRRSLAVFGIQDVDNGRGVGLKGLSAAELIELIRQARAIGYEALGSETFSEIEDPEPVTRSSSIAALMLEVRVHNLLEMAGYLTIESVLAAPHLWIMQLPNCGVRTLAYLRQRLLSYGFDWPEQGAAAEFDHSPCGAVPGR